MSRPGLLKHFRTRPTTGVPFSPIRGADSFSLILDLEVLRHNVFGCTQMHDRSVANDSKSRLTKTNKRTQMFLRNSGQKNGIPIANEK